MKRFKYLTLAALVAFAACGEEATDDIVAPSVTGTISGVVSIEGAGASGITVTLSSGATVTTDGSGAFVFSGVPAGAYTVSISGFAADAAFSPIAKSASIATTGQVATVNFDGTFVRTSAIFGFVVGGGSGLAGVSVGIGAANTTTDANGRFSFTGLRAGSYTVAISGWDATTYAFAATSMDVTVGVGESKAADFSGALMTNATISGSIFIDENDNDNVFTPELEPKLAVAGLAVALEIAPSDTIWTVTDAAGDYSFTDLEPGSYTVVFGNPAGTFAAPTSAVLPAMLAANGPNVVAQVLATAAGATVNFPVDIATQAVKVSGFLGTDAVKPGITPISGWTINIYDTQANAAAGGATGRLGTTATSATGESVFRFARSLDVSPNSMATDQVVFAQVAGGPTADYGMSGETIIEIKYAGTDSMVMAPDTFDALYNRIQMKVHVGEIDIDTLAGWTVELTDRSDTLDASSSVWTDFTDVDGDVMFDMDIAGLTALRGGLAPTMPDTFFVKLAGFQLGAGGHGFKQAGSVVDGMAAGQYIRYIWDGTRAAGDMVDLGALRVTYTDSDVTFRMHREQDDSTDMPTYTLGDNVANLTAGQIQMYDAAGVTVGAATAPTIATGLVTYLAVPTAKTYTTRARSTNGAYTVLNDTIVTFMLDGSDQTYTDATLKGGAGSSTFAVKSNNNGIAGVVVGRDGATGAKDVIVTITPTADNIQGTASFKDTTSAAGAYTFASLMEGPYTVMVEDIAGTWEFFDTLTTVAHGVSGAISGGVKNTNAYMGERDIEGFAVASVANFQPDRMDTKIEGVVVNDRDSDFNTLDPDEALSGVTIDLIVDTDKDGVVDATETAIFATTTTSAAGAYSFAALREGFYHVTATSLSNATVLRDLSATGTVTKTASVSTTATVGAGATLNQNGTRQVGNQSPPAQNDEFPRWNYLTGMSALDAGNLAPVGPNNNNGAVTTAPTHFVHLFNTGTVTGSVLAGAAGVAGVRATITRCQTAAAAPSPPAAGTCTAKHGTPSPHIQNMDTDATGKYTFTGLLEGVYQIDIAPATAGYTNIVTPGGGAYLATLQGNNDVETVPDFTIS